jgi:hypothetical protein
MVSLRILCRGLLWLVMVGAVAGCGKSKDEGGDGKASFRDQPGAAVQRDLRQLGMAFHEYSGEHNHLPLAGPSTAPQGGAVVLRRLPWRVALLPYLGAETLYRKITNDLRTRAQVGPEFWLNSELLQHRPKVYAGGADVPETHTCYRVFVGGGAAFEPDQPQQLAVSFPDGSSSTILAVEAEEAVPWSSAQELTYDPKLPLPKLGAPSRDGFYALMVDGTVRYIPKSTDEKIIRAMITRAGKEVFVMPGP